jgi:hypothetical protein
VALRALSHAPWRARPTADHCWLAGGGRRAGRTVSASWIVKQHVRIYYQSHPGRKGAKHHPPKIRIGLPYTPSPATLYPNSTYTAPGGTYTAPPTRLPCTQTHPTPLSQLPCTAWGLPYTPPGALAEDRPRARPPEPSVKSLRYKRHPASRAH